MGLPILTTAPETVDIKLFFKFNFNMNYLSVENVARILKNSEIEHSINPSEMNIIRSYQ